jgi:hypothetical protein
MGFLIPRETEFLKTLCNKKKTRPVPKLEIKIINGRKTLRI